MPTFQFDEYRLHAYDENGNPIQLTPEVVSQYLQDDFEKRFNNLPPLEVPPDQVFYITGKTAKRMIQMVFRDMNHGKRLLRDVIRKKERFRRAVLKYGVTDNKAQLALLLYSVAIQRLQIWKGEKNHGNA